MPGVGSDSSGGAPTPPWAGNRSVQWAQRRSTARRRGGFPIILRIVLAILLFGLVLTHLPLILLGVLIWFLLVHRGGRFRARGDAAPPLVSRAGRGRSPTFSGEGRPDPP